jgi:hypothetical protein
MMNLIYTRLILEWQDLSITYPLWLTHIVMDELYYVVTILVVSANCFVVGLALGFIVTLV